MTNGAVTPWPVRSRAWSGERSVGPQASRVHSACEVAAESQMGVVELCRGVCGVAGVVDRVVEQC